MKKTILLALALIAVGCAETEEIDPSLVRINPADIRRIEASPPPRNVDELKRLGFKWVDPVTLEPYSGTVFRLPDQDSQMILGKYGLLNGDMHGPYEWYTEFGELYERGYYSKGYKCGEWFYKLGENITYDPCPPGLEDES